MKKPKHDELPQSVIDAMREEDRKQFGLQSTEEREAERNLNYEREEAKNEKVIQTSVEAFLVQLGYERRTPENIGRGMPRCGWFIHLHQAKKNPILLDLLIIANSSPRQYLELELKTKTGKLSSDQAALVSQGASVAYTAEEAVDIITTWHSSL